MMPDFSVDPGQIVEALGSVLIALVLAGTVSGAFSLACYVLDSVGLYTIADRRRIRHPWLSWFPVANLWILGSLSDQYQYVVKGRIKSRRKLLLALTVALVIVYLVFIVGYLSFVGQIITLAVQNQHAVEDFVRNWFLTNGMLCLAAAAALLILAVWLAVLEFMALYDVYRSCDPRNGGTFLVLSVFFNFVRPFFLFFSRKKDQGMPPRREIPPAE